MTSPHNYDLTPRNTVGSGYDSEASVPLEGMGHMDALGQVFLAAAEHSPLSTPDSAAQPESGRQLPEVIKGPHQPSFKVVAWEHTPANSAVAGEAVADCDVVAIERVGFRSKQRRAEFDAAATLYVSDTATEAEKEKVTNLINPTLRTLLDPLGQSGKRIVTIDVNRGEPGEQENRQSLARYGRAQAHIYRSTQKMKESLQLTATELGRTNAQREAKVVQQLQDLATEYEGTDTKIGVLVGAVHTPVVHALSRSHAVQREYVSIMPHGLSGQERVYFEPLDQLIRYGSLLPCKPVPEGVVGRAVLTAIHNAAQRKEGDIVGQKSYAQRLEKLSDGQVEEMLLAVDGMRAGVRAKLHPLRTLAETQAAIEARLAQIEGQDRTVD